MQPNEGALRLLTLSRVCAVEAPCHLLRRASSMTRLSSLNLDTLHVACRNDYNAVLMSPAVFKHRGRAAGSQDFVAQM